MVTEQCRIHTKGNKALEVVIFKQIKSITEHW